MSREDFSDRIGGISTNLIAVKKSLNLTYRMIAESTDVSPEAVGTYMRGTIDPIVSWVDRFCSYYHVDKEWLLTGRGSPKFTGEVGDVELKDSSHAGERLRELRKELSITQKEICDVIGIKELMYSLIENGHSSLTEENAKKIEKEYGVGTDWLLYGDEERKRYPVCDEMIDFLWKNREIRKRIWEKSRGAD